MKRLASIIGIGTSEFSLKAAKSPTALAAQAFRAALDDAGLAKDDVDGISIHYGSPLGIDYDRFASAMGLDIRYVNQNWLNGRFIGTALQHAALAVNHGLASVVACVTSVSFSKSRKLLAGEASRENERTEGGVHGEAPAYGLTFPGGSAALCYSRYAHLTGTTPDKLAHVPISARAHAARNPGAIRREPISLADYLGSPMISAPLRQLDFCLVSDGAVVVLVGSAEMAADLKQPPVDIVGIQGLRAGRQEFIFSAGNIGVFQQDAGAHSRHENAEIYRTSGIDRQSINALYTYDAFSPLVLYTLERFGFCDFGEAGNFVADGAIAPGGSLPVNTSGGLLAEAHIGGWTSIAEIARQIRGSAEATQLENASVLQWATAWGDSLIFAGR